MEQNVTTNNRYSHGKIYKLIDNTTGVFYLGHTSLKRLDQRLRTHIRDSGDPKKNKAKLYQYFTPEKLKSGDVSIIQLDEVNANNKRELEKIENEYIQMELRNILCVNTTHSILDKVSIIKYHKKYVKENKERIQQLTKENYQNNRDKVLDRSRKYYKENKEAVLKYYHNNYENKKEKIKKYNKQYYQEISCEPCLCECGSAVARCNVKRHYNSEKHKLFIENKNGK